MRRAAISLGFCSLLVPLFFFSSDPPSAEPNPYAVQFVDITKESGIHFHQERAASTEKLYVETMGSGVAWLDYNQDGLLDALFVNSGYTPLFHSGPEPQPALYRNNGDGTFTDVTAQSGIKTNGHFFAGVAVGDFDNDGYPRYLPHRLPSFRSLSQQSRWHVYRCNGTRRLAGYSMGAGRLRRRL
jgi:hypothetical protein